MRRRFVFQFVLASSITLGLGALVAVNASAFNGAEERQAAEAKGIVTGIVKDKEGKPMPNQVVRLTKPNPNDKPDVPAARGALPSDPREMAGPGTPIARVKADASGKFEFKDVPVGTYNLVATKPGVGFAKRENVTVNASQTTNADLQMQ